MNEKKYHNYTVEEFLNDQDFIRFVKYNLQDDVAFWKGWIEANADHLENYNLAFKELKYILSAEHIQIPPFFIEELWVDIRASITEREVKKIKIRRTAIWISSIAASLVFAVFSAWYFNSDIVVKTAFGETKIVTLDDSTKIHLNSNSVLTMPRAYLWKKVRSVSLDGEAYFKVRHLNVDPATIQRGDLFVVHTPTVQIQVLGTEFNVRDRRHEAQVALISGRVLVRSMKTGKEFSMIPGNVFKNNMLNEGIASSAAQSISPSSWIEGKLILKQAKVSEIIAAFQDRYGYKVVMENQNLLNEVIDGTISLKDENGVLFTLSNILNVNIKKEGSVITLTSRR